MALRGLVGMHWRHILVLVLVVAAASLLGRVLPTVQDVASAQGVRPPRVAGMKRSARPRMARNWTSVEVDGVRLGMTPRQVKRFLQAEPTCCDAVPRWLSELPLTGDTIVMFRDCRVAWVNGHELHVRQGRASVTLHHGSSVAGVLHALGTPDEQDFGTWRYALTASGVPSLEVDIIGGKVESLSLQVN